MTILGYDVEIVWKPGKQMHIADMISQAYLPNSDNEPNIPEFEQVNMMSHLLIRMECLQQIQKETEADEPL